MDVICETKSGKIVHGDNLDVLKDIEDSSVDSCISDFPYAIEFMGKNWDSMKSWHDGSGKHSDFKGTGYSGKRRPNFYLNNLQDMENFYNWCKLRSDELMRVMKSGAYVAIFGSVKTNHRMKCAFEDSGFIIAEEIDWMYLCVSDDTDVLTKRGWVSIDDISEDDFVMTLNTDSNLLEWNKVDKIHKYDYSGEMCVIKTVDTDQLITPNHRILYKYKYTKMKDRKIHYNVSDYVYTKACELKPKAGINLPLASKYLGSKHIGCDLSYLIGFILGDGSIYSDGSIRIYQTSINQDKVDKVRNILKSLNIKYSEYSRVFKYSSKVSSLSKIMKDTYVNNYIDKHGDDEYIEYSFYIGVYDSCPILEIIDKIDIPDDFLEWCYEDRLNLFYGLIDSDGDVRFTKNGTKYFSFWQKSKIFREKFQILCFSLGFKTSWNEKKCNVGVSMNSTTQIQSKYFVNKFGEKSLPTVNYTGRVWCVSTENTNFVARRNNKIFITGNSGMPKSQDVGKMFDASGNPDLAKVYKDWKTAGLKPAHETITIFQKPLDGTYIQNIEKYGVGAMNIGACRVSISKEDIDMLNAKASKNPTTNYSDKDDKIYGKYALDMAVPANPDGRFPPNIVIDEEISKAIDVQTGISKSSGGSGVASTSNRARHIYGAYNNEINEHYQNDSLGGYGDVGGGSRLFPIFKYCPKVSPSERLLKNGERNPHVTLKPVELIKWLIKLITPVNGFTIDITAGSCTHAVACETLNIENGYNLKYLDIELCNDEENPYCDVGKQRVEDVVNTIRNKKLF